MIYDNLKIILRHLKSQITTNLRQT